MFYCFVSQLIVYVIIIVLSLEPLIQHLTSVAFNLRAHRKASLSEVTRSTTALAVVLAFQIILKNRVSELHSLAKNNKFALSLEVAITMIHKELNP